MDKKVGLVDEPQTRVRSAIPEHRSLKDEMLVEIGMVKLFNFIFILKLYQHNYYKNVPCLYGSLPC